MTRLAMFRRGLPLVLCGVLGVLSLRAGGIDDFTLLKAIPADAVVVANSRDHAGRAFLNKQAARLWDALEKSHIDRDIRRLLKEAVSQHDGNAEDFEKHWQQMSDLLAGVDWASLTKDEFAFGMKLAWPMPEYVLLMRPPTDKLADDYKGFGAILKTIAGLDENTFQLNEDKQGDLEVNKLSMSGAPVPFAIVTARTKDTLMVAFGSGWVEQSLAMLKGDGKGGIASTPRFKDAFKKLPAPTDSLAFVDIAKLMDGVRSIMDNALKMAPPPGEGEPSPEQIGKIVHKGLDGVDMFDYMAAVSTTSGMKTTSDSICTLRADAEKRALYPALFGAGTIKEPLKYVPKNAGNVTVSSGIDWLKLYQAVTKFVKEEVPNGDQMIAEFNTMQEQAGVNVETDILGWIQGNMCTFQIPGATQYATGEFVLMLRVRDEKKATEMINKAFEAITPLATQQGVTVTEVENESMPGFRSVFHPVIGMFGLRAPTIGVKDGHLFFASGPKPVEAALAVAAGKAENFSKNERFVAEGLPPATSNVVSFSFADQTKLGEQIGLMLKAIPAYAAMVGGKEAKEPIPKAIFGIMGNLGKVVEKLDFLSSECSQATFDGRAVVTKAVTNYREPPAPAAPKDDSKEGESGADTKKSGE